MYLVEHRGEVVSIDSLLDDIWTARTAEPGYVRKAVHEIRAALEDHEAQIIKTLPRVGYFIEATSIEDAKSTEEDEPSTSETSSNGRVLVYGRLSSDAYATISDRLRRKGRDTPS